MIAILGIVDHVVPLAGVKPPQELLAAHSDKLTSRRVEEGMRLLVVEEADTVVGISL